MHLSAACTVQAHSPAGQVNSRTGKQCPFMRMYTTMGWYTSLKVPIPMSDMDPHLIYGSLAHTSLPEAESRSVQLFLHSLPIHQTQTQTDTQTTLLQHPYATSMHCVQVMQLNNNLKRILN